MGNGKESLLSKGFYVSESSSRISISLVLAQKMREVPGSDVQKPDPSVLSYLLPKPPTPGCPDSTKPITSLKMVTIESGGRAEMSPWSSLHVCFRVSNSEVPECKR